MKPVTCIFPSVLALLSVASLEAAPVPKWNSDESKVAPYTLPYPLLCEDGTRVRDARTWQAKRRCEILHSFSTQPWAGAQDERFALVISNDSGEGGASLARRDFGETIAYSIAHASWRYCERFRVFVGRAADLPFDQHTLLALVAPRPLYIASATEDNLADPRGEFLSAVHAAPIYRLFGHEGLGTAEMPAPDHPIGHRVGYHLRTGIHDITAYDWEQFLNFADRHLKAAKP